MCPNGALGFLVLRPVGEVSPTDIDNALAMACTHQHQGATSPTLTCSNGYHVTPLPVTPLYLLNVI